MHTNLVSSPAEIEKMKYEWIRSELELINKQIPAWSEADQKIVAVMATLVVAIVGLASSTIVSNSGNVPAYMIFLTSILMCFAAIQSSLYSSLILLALERKVALSKTLNKFLSGNETEDIALTIYSPENSEPFRSYKQGVMPYLVFRGTIGIILAMIGFLYSKTENNDLKFYASFGVALCIGVAALLITTSHLAAFDNFMKRRPRPEVDDTSPVAIEVDPFKLNSWTSWLKKIPLNRPKPTP